MFSSQTYRSLCVSGWGGTCNGTQGQVGNTHIKASVPHRLTLREVNQDVTMFLLVSCFALVASALGEWLRFTSRCIYLSETSLPQFGSNQGYRSWLLSHYWDCKDNNTQNIPGRYALLWDKQIIFVWFCLRVWSACYQAPSERIQQDCKWGDRCVWVLALAGFTSGSLSSASSTSTVELCQSRLLVYFRKKN